MEEEVLLLVGSPSFELHQGSPPLFCTFSCSFNLLEAMAFFSLTLFEFSCCIPFNVTMRDWWGGDLSLTLRGETSMGLMATSMRRVQMLRFLFGVSSIST